MRALGINVNLTEVAMLVGGTWILLDRGVSLTYILGVALLAVGANRVARNF